MYKLKFTISHMQNIFKAYWEKEYTEGRLPPPRTSHTSTAYKNTHLIIIGGEGYDQSNKMKEIFI